MAVVEQRIPSGSRPGGPAALSRHRRLWKHRQGILGGFLVSFFVVMAIFAPLIATDDPAKIDLQHTLAPSAWSDSEDGSGLLGKDAIGRDIFSRIVHGARISLLVGAVAVFIGMSIGVPLGLLAGFEGRPIDDIITRIADIQSAIPFLVLLIAILTFIGGGLFNVIIFLGASSWVGFMRLVRGETMSVKTRGYVRAAQALGAGRVRIMFQHILPNVMATIIVAASLSFGGMILTESALSFLGLGVDPSTPTWGRMLAEAREDILVAFGPTLYPGLSIMLVVLGANLFGDWLRDRLDPRLRGL
jgi:peptide/nickel transport system permease protein